MAEAQARTGRPVVVVAKILISGGLLALLLSQVELARIWAYLRMASMPWLALACALYLGSTVLAIWRWALLLDAQGVAMPWGQLATSYLVAMFFNNFLPSNIGGDVVRIKDTAQAAGSKTLATTVVIVDRAIGLLGLGLVAAIGASVLAEVPAMGPSPVWPSILWLAVGLIMALSAPAVLAPAGVGRVLQPLRVFHAEWVEERITRITNALSRFRARPLALLGCFAGAVLVQAVLVVFYIAIAYSMRIPISPFHMAVIVPMTLIVQMLPVSVNGLGVREATFAFYFTQLGLPLESALVVSLVGAGLMLLFSLLGTFAYIGRRP